MTSLHELLRKARYGDQAAMNELLESFYPRVSEDVHRKLQRSGPATLRRFAATFSTGDMVQEIFIKVVASLDRFTGEDDETLVHFLGVLVRNTLVDRLRFFAAECRNPRRVTEASIAAEAGGGTPSARVSANEEVGLYRELLCSFPEREQRLLRMRIEGGVSFPTLARELGYPTEDAARKAYNSARAKLLLRLQQRGVGT